MNGTNPAAELDRIKEVCRLLRELGATTVHPGVASALRHSLYYAHLAGGYLGDDLLSPEVDAFLESLEDET